MDDPHPPTHPAPLDLTIKQQARVYEYLATALEDPDPLRANVAAASSGLMELARQLKTGLDGAIASGLDPFNDLEKLSPALNVYLRMTRQIQSFAQLDGQLANARGGSPQARIPSAEATSEKSAT